MLPLFGLLTQVRGATVEVTCTGNLLTSTGDPCRCKLDCYSCQGNQDSATSVFTAGACSKVCHATWGGRRRPTGGDGWLIRGAYSVIYHSGSRSERFARSSLNISLLSKTPVFSGHVLPIQRLENRCRLSLTCSYIMKPQCKNMAVLDMLAGDCFDKKDCK